MNLRIYSSSRFGRCCLCALLLAIAVLIWLTLRWEKQITVAIEVSSPTRTQAQLFYDIGRGFNSFDSRKAIVLATAPGEYRQVLFVVPRHKLRALQIRPGNLSLRRISFVLNRQVLDSQTIDVLPFVPQHLTWVRWMPSNKAWLTLFGGELILLLVYLLLLRQEQALKLIGPRLIQLLERFSSKEPSTAFLPIDTVAVAVYAGSTMLFVIACCLCLNGSSSAIYSISYGRGAAQPSLMGDARSIRVDEWAYVTPDILNQASRARRFEVAFGTLGNHNVALTGNIPVRHFSTLFRPQLWPFFVLPLDYAYSVMWQAKALLLFLGVFTFLLWLTRSSGWACTGALWYYFSPFTQWTYSWPSGLPEMVGCLCIAAVCFAYLLVGQRRGALLASGAALVLFSINFALTAYLPHLIPLAWLGVATVLAWVVSERRRLLPSRLNIIVLLTSLTVLAGVGLALALDLRVAIAAVSQTVYPGKRVFAGGTMHLWQFGAQLLPWGLREDHFPVQMGNVCEGSGFLWLAPLAVLACWRSKPARFGRYALVSLSLLAALLTCWLVLPIPSAWGHLFGMDRTGLERVFPALGLLNIAITAVVGSGMRRAGASWKVQATAFAASLACLLPMLHVVNGDLGEFYKWPTILAGGAYIAILITCYLCRQKWVFAVALILPQAIATATVNPVVRGLPVFLHSDLRRYVQGHPRLLEGKWLAYSDTPVVSGFLAASGLDVYTGTHYLPDIDHFGVLANHGLDVNLFNRLGYLDAHAIPAGKKTTVVQDAPVVVEWRVAASDPVLREVGIRYVAFDVKPTPELIDGLTPVVTHAVDGFWLYEIRP